MATIKKYQDKDGNTRYQFQVYLGVDPKTGKKKSRHYGLTVPVISYDEVAPEFSVKLYGTLSENIMTAATAAPHSH